MTEIKRRAARAAEEAAAGNGEQPAADAGAVKEGPHRLYAKLDDFGNPRPDAPESEDEASEDETQTVSYVVCRSSLTLISSLLFHFMFFKRKFSQCSNVRNRLPHS